ncbi:hypothetical protein B0H14DRAFT_2688451 [Mycena olivaceomarginata]|nr:hypothetical protein B0H14DRAFT_2688451 [Mycena olivaceomarginata]
MSGIALLVPDLLSEIMFALPSSISQKFAFAQVSRRWRDLALDSHLFWSSFTGGDSKVDCHRVPLILERSGAMLHIHFRFTSGKLTDWPADALKALVPHVARIVSLHIEFTTPMNVDALLNSALEFSTLQTLRLKSSIYRNVPGLLITAPELRTLDIERIHLTHWDTLLSPSLESIRLCDSPVEMLLEILKRCPRARCIVLQTWYPWSGNSIENSFAALPSRPIAPALRELELRVRENDLVRILKAGFSDVVLHSLAGCIYNGHSEDDVELLSGALLPGVGSLVIFRLVDMRELELHDGAGHIRRLRCWNDDSYFEVMDAWKYLSDHYGLHKTVREIQIRPEYWDEYLEVFESYAPQLEDGITLTIETDWDTFSADNSKIMRLPGLAKVEFHDSRNADYLFRTVSDVLALIEPPKARKVQVCIGKKKYAKQDALFGSLRENDWAICAHCES